MEHFSEEKEKICKELKCLWRYSDNKKTSKKLVRKVIKLKDKYENISNNTWKEVMKLESVLNEQMMELNEIFEHAFTDLVSNFIEQAQEMFVIMRDVVTSFNDILQEIAQSYYATVVFEEEEAEKDRIEAERKQKEEEQRQKQADMKAAKSGKMKSATPYETKIEVIVDELPMKKEGVVNKRRVPAELRPYVKNRDTLVNALAGSRDVHLLMVDNREDLLVSRARDWQEEIIKNLNENEIKRNRDKILEITSFFEMQKKEFNSLISEVYDTSKNISSD